MNHFTVVSDDVDRLFVDRGPAAVDEATQSTQAVAARWKCRRGEYSQIGTRRALFPGIFTAF